MAARDRPATVGNTGGDASARDQAAFEAIAHFLRTELFPGGDRFSQHVLLTLYRLLAEGSPVTLESLNAACGGDRAAVDTVVEEIAPSRLRYDDTGRIVAFAGLTQRPTKHRFVLPGRELFTWCAFDALFLPQLLNGTAEISTGCPSTDTIITMTVGGDGVQAANPAAAVMSFVTPDNGRCHTDLRGTFCNHVHFFASRPAAEIWLARNPAATILSLQDAVRLARIRNEAAFGDVLTGHGPSDFHP